MTLIMFMVKKIDVVQLIIIIFVVVFVAVGSLYYEVFSLNPHS